MSSLPQPFRPNTSVVETRSPEETRRLAAALTPILLPGDVLSLTGDLGAGKTTFVQGLAAGLKISEQITSPTFILMKEYRGGRYPLMHIDVYRLDRVQEVIDLGYDEFLDPAYIVAVEWGDVVEPLLPREHLVVELRYGKNDHIREIALIPRGLGWQSRMDTVRMLTAELFAPLREHGLESR
jgi:tRNA threonylcarbamoyladenosine biosynthesis protein TsaE